MRKNRDKEIEQLWRLVNEKTPSEVKIYTRWGNQESDTNMSPDAVKIVTDWRNPADMLKDWSELDGKKQQKIENILMDET